MRLASVLVGAWQPEGQGQTTPPAATPALEAALQAALAAGRARWPALAVDDQDFVRHLTRSSLRGVPEPVAALAQLCVGDLYLACACAAGVPGAAAAFEAAHLADLGAALAGTVRASAAEVDEIRQQLRVKLLVGGGTAERPPLIASYSGRGPLGVWVRVAAVRTALTQVRNAQLGARAGQRAADEALHAGVPADPELAFLKDRYRPDFAQAFQAALNAVDDRQRALLRLHFVAGLTLEKIGVIYDVDRSTVSRWLAAARQDLLDATERNLRAQLGTAPGEFQSMARLLTSQLEIDLPELLRTAGAND